MFRRKEDEFGMGGSMSNNDQQNNISGNTASPQASTSPYHPPSRPAGDVPGSNPAARQGAAIQQPYRPAGEAPRRPADSRAPMASGNPAARGEKSGKRILTVGTEILLKGEIATCDRLVIEGSVDATLNEVHTVEIAETGSFTGNAEIQDAEISGLFEGDLVVHNRLVIYSTGKVRGKITYGEIEVERGGELSGQITLAPAGSSESAAKKKQPVAA